MRHFQLSVSENWRPSRVTFRPKVNFSFSPAHQRASESDFESIGRSKPDDVDVGAVERLRDEEQGSIVVPLITLVEMVNVDLQVFRPDFDSVRVSRPLSLLVDVCRHDADSAIVPVLPDAMGRR